MRKNCLVKSISIILSVVLLTGCYGKLPDIENHILEDAYSEDAVVFRTLYSAEVVNLNYLVTSTNVDTAICANVIDALVDYDNKGNIIPGLASSWESNEDMTEWTFHLRDDITWVDYNGNYYADVVADDFVAAAEYVNDATNESDSQYMYSSGAVVLNAKEYYEYTLYQIHPELFETAPEPVYASSIGVKAIDDKTVKYILAQPCPFFPSVLSYATYLPICRKYLNKVGVMFAKDNKYLLYNGAYILQYFTPLEKQILVKNPSYWDKNNVHLDRIENIYDSAASSIGPEQYISGNIDKAIIEPENLKFYMSNQVIGKYIHRSMPDSSYSFFYAFNFSPTFDYRYEPDNWKKAVANDNFRNAILYALDKVKILSIYEPYQPERLVNNTITPRGAISFEGKDYTEYGKLGHFTINGTYNKNKARFYRDIARIELEREDIKFPVKMLMPYNPSTPGWKQEAEMIEDQLENTLGTAFIDVIVEAGSDTGFLQTVRRSGKYAFLKCQWGAEYDDPQAWTVPFENDEEFIFWNNSKDPEIQEIREKWKAQIALGASYATDIDARYKEFAEAENILISNAIVVPFSINYGDGYVISKLNEFEGEYSTYGLANQKFKYYKKLEESMKVKEYEQAYEKWLEE